MSTISATSPEELTEEIEEVNWTNPLLIDYLKGLCEEYLQNKDSGQFIVALETLAQALDLV